MIARKIALWGLAALFAITVLTGTGIGLSAATKSYKRAELRADADNRVTLARIDIRRAAQQALIARAQIDATKADAASAIRRR
jgi:hypothetical protein